VNEKVQKVYCSCKEGGFAKPRLMFLKFGGSFRPAFLPYHPAGRASTFVFGGGIFKLVMQIRMGGIRKIFAIKLK